MGYNEMLTEAREKILASIKYFVNRYGINGKIATEYDVCVFSHVDMFDGNMYTFCCNAVEDDEGDVLLYDGTYMIDSCEVGIETLAKICDALAEYTYDKDNG